MTLYTNFAERPVANLALLAISISINNYMEDFEVVIIKD